ncbi:MAG TPA: hypothetical protein VK474_00595 [Chthoniobacterales bacterium]|nr:hypothetical protein [Chthoniobacterales bacterium]
MKRLLAVFALTVSEQRVIIVLLLALVAWMAWRTRQSAREFEPVPAATAPAATPSASPL